MVDRLKVNYVVDVLMLLSFVVMFVTGLLKWPGLLYGLGFENINFEVVSLFHRWSGLLMGIVAFAHISLHWNWISLMTKKYYHDLRGRDFDHDQHKDRIDKIHRTVIPQPSVPVSQSSPSSVRKGKVGSL